MNHRWTAALQRTLEEGDPDRATSVKAQSDGVVITIAGQLASPGVSGPGTTSVEMRLCDGSPFLERLLQVRAARAARAAEDT
jgi:hypothetical protein